MKIAKIIQRCKSKMPNGRDSGMGVAKALLLKLISHLQDLCIDFDGLFHSMFVTLWNACRRECL